MCVCLFVFLFLLVSIAILQHFCHSTHIMVNKDANNDTKHYGVKLIMKTMTIKKIKLGVNGISNNNNNKEIITKKGYKIVISKKNLYKIDDCYLCYR